MHRDQLITWALELLLSSGLHVRLQLQNIEGGIEHWRRILGNHFG